MLESTGHLRLNELLRFKQSQATGAKNVYESACSSHLASGYQYVVFTLSSNRSAPISHFAIKAFLFPIRLSSLFRY